MGRTWDALRRAEEARGEDRLAGDKPRSFFSRRSEPAVDPRDSLFEMMLGDLTESLREELGKNEERLVERVDTRIQGVDAATKQAISQLADRVERETRRNRVLLGATCAFSFAAACAAVLTFVAG